MSQQMLHYERYTHPLQHECTVVTKEAKMYREQKTEMTDCFIEQYRSDIFIGGEDYKGYN